MPRASTRAPREATGASAWGGRRAAHRSCAPPPRAVATSKSELHDLLAKPALEGIPMLVLGNKNDLDSSIGVDALIEKLELKQLANREVCCYSISAKNSVNSTRPAHPRPPARPRCAQPAALRHPQARAHARMPRRPPAPRRSPLLCVRSRHHHGLAHQTQPERTMSVGARVRCRTTRSKNRHRAADLECALRTASCTGPGERRLRPFERSRLPSRVPALTGEENFKQKIQENTSPPPGRYYRVRKITTHACVAG